MAPVSPASPAPDAPAVAVVLAGGSGTRVGSATNKVYLPLAGRPAIAHALAALRAAPSVGPIVLVLRAGDEELAGAAARAAGVEPAAVVHGGASRAASERAGLAAVQGVPGVGDATVVLLHDGARPFPSVDLVEALVAAAREGGGAVPAVPFAEPVLDESGAPVPAGALRRMQTPQAFRLGDLVDAYAAARRDGFDGLDTADPIARYAPHVVIAAVPGDERNLKVTTPDDLAAAEALAATFDAGRWVDP